MLTRLGRYADKTIEYGWLLAAVFTPLYFNVYSSRVFEPDKISTLRSFVLIMTLAWVIKLLESGVDAYRQSGAETARGKLTDTTRGVAEGTLPGWLGFLRVPMILPILVYALAYLVSTLFSVTLDTSVFGSYQRLQGTYSQYSYMMLGILVIANLRTRAQADRLVNFMILASLPVALYGIVQAAPLINDKWVLDPLPWAGDTATRVASTMGNAIFVAAWLIMIVPLTVYKLFNGVSAGIAARRAQAAAPEQTERTRSLASRKVEVDKPLYGWAVVGNGFGILLIQAMVFLLALRLMKGLPFPDASWSWVLPTAIFLFYIGCHLIEWLGRNRANPRQISLYMPIIGVTLFFTALLATCVTWSVRQIPQQDGTTVFQPQSTFDAGAFLWVLCFTLLWGAVCAGAYTLASDEHGQATLKESPVVRLALNVGCGILIFMQILTIYLTQSRGPWLGLGVGLAVFALGMWLVGRSRRVRWMARFGGTVSAIVLALVIFVGVLNIPGSPLQSLSNMPVFGRGIERLSTLFRTEDGTGKVRELIWEGATNLILAEPARSVVGWGPEAMYVAYNPYYPAELAQWELRNATPDRSHNAEFDQMVTMGALGLFAYYLLVAAFFAYGVRLLRRVATTRDQLFVIAMLSVMSAHFIEIQTGIQIAATWSYFYLLVGLMVAFGYYVTPHLREREAVQAEAVPVRLDGQANGSVSEDEVLEPVAAIPSKRRAATVATAQQSATATMSVEGGSNAGREKGAKPQQPTTNGKSPAGRTPTTTAQGRQSADGKNRSLASRPERHEERPYSSPLRLGVYAALALGVVAFNFGLGGIAGVNSSEVRADTIYKNGLTFDGQKGWPEAIEAYRQAIALQPNQDYYYLFLGRAWLEFAKQTDQENENLRIKFPNKVPLDVDCTVRSQAYDKAPSANPNSDPSRLAEKDCRLRQGEHVLNTAHDLNPLNSDHYANLGRLYLYWADATGTGDTTKSPLAVANMKAASERTPGNAQLRNELAVAYARNNQFDKAVESLTSAQALDPRYERTPYLRGQLYQERVGIVREALINKQPLPTDGEADYGKLLVETGKAYSDTIGVSISQFVDTSVQSRLNYLLSATAPFTATNTTLDQANVGNVLTSTIKVALEAKVAEGEKAVADLLRRRGAYAGEGNVVPTDILQAVWQNPVWATIAMEGEKVKSVDWKESIFPDTAKTAVLAHYALGYIYQKTGLPARASESYNRMLALDPNNQEARAALSALEGTTP